ncbi:SPOR domain-containing protein [Enterobacteriaceae bacterium LUAb1]
MDEFNPEDELKADISDRRNIRPRRSPLMLKVSISRQHLMMGMGIVILLLLVIGIGSALKGPGDSKTPVQQPIAEHHAEESTAIDLSGSSAMRNAVALTPSQEPENLFPSQADNTQGNVSSQNVGLPPISSTPTEAQPVPVPQNQQRIELPGDLNNALSSQQGATIGVGLPTAQATTGAKSDSLLPVKKLAPRLPQRASDVTHKKEVASKRVHKPASHDSNKPGSHAVASTERITALSGGNYTLQLSSASRPDTLKSWAKKQNLAEYHVYKTVRNGQPWYVLVSGSYATPDDAKHAAAALPAEVRAQNPWVKPVSQIKKGAQ